MSLIPSSTTLRVEDFPEQKEWIGKLFLPINTLITAFTSAINGNITYGDNIPSVTQALEFVYGGPTDYPKKFRWTLPVKPVEVRVAQAFEDNTPVAVVCAWSYADNQISITEFVRLSSFGAQELVERSNYKIIVRAVS